MTEEYFYTKKWNEGSGMNDKLRECIRRNKGEWLSKRLVLCKAKDECEHRLPDQDGRFCKLSPSLEEMYKGKRDIIYPPRMKIHGLIAW